MTPGRVLSAVAASAVVAGAAVVVVGMAHGAARPAAQRLDRAAGPLPAPTSRPASVALTVGPSPTPTPSASITSGPVRSVPTTTAPSTRARTTSVAPVTVAATPTTAPTAPTSTAASPTHTPTPNRTTASPTVSPTHTVSVTPSAPVAPTPTHTATPTPTPTHDPTHSAPPAHHPSTPKGRRLPLGFRTHNARRVITVVASSTSTTVATLQAWTKAKGGGWVRHGGSVTAHVGTQGMTRHASESKSATPIGSFTLTRAFGHNRNPGTKLPYIHTTPADWWISQAGPLYNTEQRCSSGCSFTQGSPNEHLYYETPYYNYAVVIDYNTRNSPTGVRQGRGSAFFLHVHPAGTGGTAGCVDIPQAKLKRLMRWLHPSAHPRILIGVR